MQAYCGDRGIWPGLVESFNLFQGCFLIFAIFILSHSEVSLAQGKKLVDEEIHVAYIHESGYEFWDTFLAFSQNVAQDLGIRLSVIDTDTMDYVRSLASMDDKPQYMLYHYRKEHGPEMMRHIDALGIRSFIVNTDIPSSQIEQMGRPRGRYKTWIAHMFPDDRHAGFLLGESLIHERRLIDKQYGIKRELLNIGAIVGSNNTTVSFYRMAGLAKKVKYDNSLVVRKLLPTNWSYEEARQAADSMLKTYPDISVIWAAGDSLAIGAIETAKKHKLIPGKDLVVGGIDWSKKGISRVANGQLATSIGGHFMEGGWALVLIYDLHKGFDFSSELGTKINLPMQVINARNVSQYMEIFGQENWKKIDFKYFSKAHNPDLIQYDFSLKNLFEAYAIAVSKK